MKAKVHAHWTQSSWDPEPVLSLHTHDMSKSFPGYIHAGEFEIDLPIEPPSHAEIVKGKVADLRKQQAELIHKSDQIEERIQQLMALPHLPETESA